MSFRSNRRNIRRNNQIVRCPMSDKSKLNIEVPRWVSDKLNERAKALGVPVDGLARSILESAVLGIGYGSPAPTPAPPTIHNPQPSGAPPTPAPPTIHNPKPSYAPPTPAPPTIHNPQPSGAPPTPAPPTIHHPASGRTVGWRELAMDHVQTCANCGTEIAGGQSAYVAMDDTGVFRTTMCGKCFSKRSKG